MKYRYICGVITILAVTAAVASCGAGQNKSVMKENVTVTVKTDTDTDSISLYVFPLGVESDDNTPMSGQADGTLIQTIPTAPTGLYEMVCVRGTSQYTLPLYIDGTQDSVRLSVNLDAECPIAKLIPSDASGASQKKAKLANASLDALNRFNALYYRLSRDVWTGASGMSEDDIRAMVAEYTDKAAELGRSRKVNDNVRQYINVWAYLQSVESGNVFNRMNEKHVELFGNDGNALLDMPETVLDTPVAALHQSALSVASQALPKGSLTDRLQYISDNYSDATMREGIQRIVLNSYIRNYRFADGFQNGLDALTEAQEKFGIDRSYIDSFTSRASAVPGAPFPDVKLVDAGGNSVSIVAFRGKFIYVDLWASWCIPCCREVPYLQALEKDMKDSDVVFASISIDSSEQPWKEKMEQLQMHGNQWWNEDGTLCDRLNVSGIPHFLIYDREGRLHTYDAPRPSSGSALKALLNGLQAGRN